MNRYIRLFHTLRHLRLRQIFYQVFYRLSGRLQSSNASEKEQRTAPSQERSHIVKGNNSSTPGRSDPSLLHSFTPSVLGLSPSFNKNASFTFLNVTEDFEAVSSIDWNFQEHGKLWTYNLNYFEFLRHSNLQVVAAQNLIDDWIEKSDTHVDGWEPYPISLRIVHWIRFYEERELMMPDHVFTSLHQQYRNLQRKIEYHLMGNHLLENAIALTMAASFFDDQEYLKKANKLLTQQLKEQYLSSGAHYECSTMYHCILLWRSLDLYAHGKGFPAENEASAGIAFLKKPCYIEVLKKTITNQLNWLRYVVDEYGNYPHFNDSTNGIAPSVASILDYATSLDSYFGQPNTKPVQPTQLLHWIWPYNKLKLDVWIDASSVGPSYIPGHAHADDLTFCLSLGGRRIIVDPAISTYEKNERRAWERSTLAHNTVTVGNQNSSDVWGGFRVGKRARTAIEAFEKEVKLVARHDGYPGGHRRTFERIENGVEITDECEHEAVARFHFDHSCLIKITGNELLGDDFSINWSATAQANLDEYQQATGFNQLRTAQVLEITFTGELITIFTNHLSPIIRY